MASFSIDKPPRPARKHRAPWYKRILRSAFLAIIVAFALTISIQAALAVPPTFGGCYISTGHGLVQDIDCDRIPDFADNCPVVP
ncbi:hypothetical protein GOV10_03530, partial [Candidatus Woesearchaeota archaeon]|nr:hypothetical protein [Candidatus Woesearchaeota archaeon]